MNEWENFAEIVRNYFQEKQTKALPSDNFRGSSYFHEMKLDWYFYYHHISKEEQCSCNSAWLDILLKTHFLASCCVAYKCHNSKIGQKFQVHLFLAHQEMKKLPKYGKIKYCQHKSHKFAFEESCFNKSVSLRKRFMKSKDKFMFKFAPVF